MKTAFLFLLVSFVSAQTEFEKKISKENEAAMNNEKLKCRWVCDKKLYKEQKITEAISFYKNAKEYSFSKKEF
jgi:hypothetical protein